MFNRSSEFVSLFIDDILKRGIKGKTESEVDQLLDKAIILLRYVTDRDMFERYYQKHLARRLLQGKSESQDAEKEMISRMKQEMGNHFTTKFEGMFKDMELSRDLSDSYRTHIRSLGDVDHKQVDLSINVLTSNNWPPDVMGRTAPQDGNPRVECNYPPDIKRLQSSFFKYYLKDRSGRVLTWVGTAGSADIKCVFPKVPGKDSGPLSKDRRYELNVSTYGMIVLLLFNDLPDGESLSFEEIQAKTNIPVPDLVRTLASISVAPKARVLLKEPATKVVKSSDHFSFNTTFTSKTMKIKAPTISNISKVEGEEERKSTEKKNDETRAHIVDAALVRIMK
jgi:cullin 3